MPSKKVLMDSVVSGQPYVLHPVRDVMPPSIKTTSYTLILTDHGTVIEFNGTALQTLTIPQDASVNFPIGTVINVSRINTGSVVIAGSFGMSVTTSASGTGSGIYLRAQWSEATLRKRAADSWVVSGDLILQ